MESFKNIFLLSLILVLSSCGEETPTPAEPTTMDLLSQKWVLQNIYINGREVGKIDSTYEYNNGSAFRLRLDLKRFIYRSDGIYLLDWVRRGEYNLGTPGDPNWQPRNGYFHLDDTETKIIHNQGMDYSAEYTIEELTKNTFIRSSIRYMSEDDQAPEQLWQRGDEVEFIERFTKDGI